MSNRDKWCPHHGRTIGYWRHSRKYQGATDVFDVISPRGRDIGTIYWSKRAMRYVFCPWRRRGIRIDWQSEIAAFCTEQTTNR